MHIRDIPRPSQTVQVGTGYAVLTGSMRALTPLAPVHFRSYAKSEDPNLGWSAREPARHLVRCCTHRAALVVR